MKTIVNEELISFKELEKKIYSRDQRAKQPCLHGYLATAARVKDPAALQRCKFDTQLLAAGSLTIIPIIAYDILNNNKYSEMGI